MPKSFSFNVTGTSRMQRRLSHARDKLDRDSQLATHDEGQSVFDSSQSIVPIGEGDLKLSGNLTEVERTTDDMSVEITYGNERVDYAAAVHESPTNPGRKYLERPMNESETGMSQRIAGKVKL